MKAIPLLLFGLSLLCWGCNRRDSELSHNLVGTWTYKSEEYPGTQVFKADGTFSADWLRIQRGESTQAFKFAGTWRVRDAKLITMVSSSNAIPIKVNYESRIISLNKDEFTYLHIDAPMTVRRVN